MAWVRTALALITFGFTIAKYFEFQQDKPGERPPLVHPRTVGILMITIGLVSLALGSVQHTLAVRALRKEWPGLPRSLAGVTAGLLALLGIAALLGAGTTLKGLAALLRIDVDMAFVALTVCRIRLYL